MNSKRLTQRGTGMPHRVIILAERRVCNSLHTRVLFATLLAWCLFTLPARAGQTSTYSFLPDKSTITQTGGIAGIHRTYTTTGTFQLTTDFEAGTASIDRVDANGVDDSPERHTLDPNNVFNMTELAGTIIDKTTIQFKGTADDGSSVLITMSFADDSVSLKGGTTPPPNSADFFIFTIDAFAQRKYSGGTGDPNDPYQIATAADLIALGETTEDYNKHFILTADIDLDPNLPGGKVFDKAVIAPDTDPSLDEYGWDPFNGKPFTGVFDGSDHTISHLTIVGDNYIGLFGCLSDSPFGPKVRNLGVVNANIRATGSNVGGLVGYGSSGVWLRPKISNCYCTGMINGDSHVGGLVGDNECSINVSYSTATVNGTGDCVGGLVGFNYDDDWEHGCPVLTNCYSTGEVSGRSSIGGLVGFNGKRGSITSSYSTASVNGESGVGGLVGSNDGGSVTGSFWDIQTSKQTSSSGGGTGNTTAEMQRAKTFLDAGWDFVDETANGTEDIWWILEGKDYPRLSWQLPADDFEDGKPEPLWFVYEVDSSLVQIKEVNGRLETVASAEAQNIDAFYVSDGWRLDVTKGFAIQVNFHFSKQGDGDGRVTFGVVPVLDPSARQWAEMEAGCFESGPFYLYEVRDGSWVRERFTDRSSDDGTLYISYDPDSDELYFSYTGYGKAKAWQTMTGLLKGRWASEPVYIILGGGSEGMALTGPDAWLDKFAVSTGALILN